MTDPRQIRQTFSAPLQAMEEGKVVSLQRRAFLGVMDHPKDAARRQQYARLTEELHRRERARSGSVLAHHRATP